MKYPEVASIEYKKLQQPSQQQQQQQRQDEAEESRPQPQLRENSKDDEGDVRGKDYGQEYDSTVFGPNASNDWLDSRQNLLNSAFVKHKTHRRNSHRNGHKTHKKRYKDFVRYSISNDKDYDDSHNTYPMYSLGQMSYFGDDGHHHKRSHRRHHHSHPHSHPNHQRNNQIGKYAEYREPDDGPTTNNKWPHLSRVQYQLRNEAKSLEQDLPPYMKKYNRRNKQLLNLLEGTMPPHEPPPSSSNNPNFNPHRNAMALGGGVGGVGSYLTSNKRGKPMKLKHRYHNHKNPKWLMEDLFEEQKANPNNPNPNSNSNANNNPTDQYGISAGITTQSIPATATTAVVSTTTTPEPPKPIPRVAFQHPSASSSSRANRNGFDDDEEDNLKLLQQNEFPGDDISVSSSSEDTDEDVIDWSSKIPPKRRYFSDNYTNGPIQPQLQPQQQAPSQSQPQIAQFAYHRVDAPRAVGAGETGRKQRLPFVAITDRRLETSKMMRQQKDFQQNHFPRP